MPKDRVTLEGPKIGQTWRLTYSRTRPHRLVVLVVLTRFVEGHKWYGLVLEDPEERHSVGREIFAAVSSELEDPPRDDDYKWTRVA